MSNENGLEVFGEWLGLVQKRRLKFHFKILLTDGSHLTHVAFMAVTGGYVCVRQLRTLPKGELLENTLTASFSEIDPCGGIII